MVPESLLGVAAVVDFQGLGQTPCQVSPVPTTMTLLDAISLLGGFLVESLSSSHSIYFLRVKT
jgi:hypothetical protein